MPVPPIADSLSDGVLTDLQFEEEGAAWPGKSRVSTPQQASQTVRTLCSLTSNPQQVGPICNWFKSASLYVHLINTQGTAIPPAITINHF